jgi:hypothetical protein
MRGAPAQFRALLYPPVVAVEARNPTAAGPSDGVPIGSSARAGVTLAIAAAAIVTLVLADAWNALTRFGFRFTDEDQAGYWYGAQEFAHLHFREPFYYGQPYIPMLESALMVPLQAVRNEPWVLLPLVSTLLGLGAWWLVAFVAWRRRRPLAALVILAGPLLLVPDYLLQLGVPFNGGIFVAALGLVAAELMPGERTRGFAFGLLAALGTLYVLPNTAVLALPAGILLALQPGARVRRWQGIIAGGALGALCAWAAGLFYTLHPGWVVSAGVLQPGLGRGWHWSLFLDGLGHLHRHLGFYAPWFWTSGAAPLLALALIGVVAAWWRSWAVALGAWATLAAVLFSFGLNKVHEGQAGVFFSFDRMYVAVPLAIAVLVAALEPPRRLLPAGAGAALLAALAAVSFAAATIALPAAVADAARFPAIVYEGPRTVASMRDECAALDRAAVATGADLAVYLQNRGFAYGCSALLYGRVEAIYPSYERRTWLLQQENVLDRSKVLFAQAPAGFCLTAQAAGYGCADVDGYDLVTESRPGPTIPLLRRLGIDVRVF